MTQKTLLDEFAMVAMGAIISNDNQIKAITQSYPDSNVFADSLAEYAYYFAQAMIKERQKHEFNI